VKYPFQKFFDAEGGQAGGGNSGGEPTNNQQQQQNNVDPVVSKNDNMVPKNRFDEINNKYKDMLAQIQEFQRLETERTKQDEENARKKREEQGEFQRLYEETQKKLEETKKFEERSNQLEKVINSMVETRLTSIPKEFHDLIPANLSAEKTLEWITKAESKGLFTPKQSKSDEIGKPFNHSNEGPKVDSKSMSALDKILAGLGGK
jgi:seryl-tRNA synthetase